MKTPGPTSAGRETALLDAAAEAHWWLGDLDARREEPTSIEKEDELVQEIDEQHVLRGGVGGPVGRNDDGPHLQRRLSWRARRIRR